MNHKQTKKMESGHSMIEMLGALMIMGLLGITMVVGIRIALNKLKANQIIKDARLSHTMLLTNIQRQEESIDWRDVLFTSNSGKYVQNRYRDEQAQTKVIEVEQAVCEELIGFSEGAKFYTLDAAGLHPLESCAEKQDMVIILDMAQGEEVATGCVTKDDCTNGWCNEGTCVTCPEGEAVNEEGTGCTIFCNDDQAVCDDGDIGHTWCCPKEQCTPEYPKCTVTDGKCSWKFTQSAPTTNCSWTFTQTPPQTNCSWTFTQTPATSNCTVTMVYSEDNTSVESITSTGCSAGQYCYVAYTNSDCTSSVQNTSTGTLHGVCNSLATTNTTCIPHVTMNEIDRCDQDQYCYIYYTDTDCASEHQVENGSSGTLYGVCNPLATTITTCVPDVTMEELDGCDEEQYCYINYTNTDCASGHQVANGSSGTLYGVCNPLATTNTACVPLVHMDAQTYCPSGQYCLLNWPTDDDCSATLSNNTTGTLYGACAAISVSDPACPYSE